MMLRDGLIYLSRQRQLGNVVTTVPLARHLAERFVAGETLDRAIPVVRALNARRIHASLDHLGESVRTAEEAVRAAAVYLEILDRSRFEFQMLYGIRRDLQEELARDGYNVRVYVPFGTEWFAYSMRRLAERPANLAFLLPNAFRG